MRLYDRDGDPITAEDVLDGDELGDYYDYLRASRRRRV